LREQKRMEMSDIYWRRAISMAEKQTEQLTALAQLATIWNWDDQIEELLHIIIRQDHAQNWAWEILLQRRMAAKDTEGLYQLYSEMLKQNPNSAIAKNNIAVIDLLLDRNTNQAMRFAKEVYLSATNNPIPVSTYALALHQQNKSADALKLMKTLPPAELSRPEVAIYYGVLLSANGQREAAKPYFEAAQKGTMLPEEKQLVEKYSNR
jgi:tetratricopeptide (TPR) repeat protein